MFLPSDGRHTKENNFTRRSSCREGPRKWHTTSSKKLWTQLLHLCEEIKPPIALDLWNYNSFNFYLHRYRWLKKAIAYIESLLPSAPCSLLEGSCTSPSDLYLDRGKHLLNLRRRGRGSPTDEPDIQFLVLGRTWWTDHGSSTDGRRELNSMKFWSPRKWWLIIIQTMFTLP